MRFQKVGAGETPINCRCGRGDMQVAKNFLPIVHLMFSNLQTWPR
jgi:hypothetical protein